MLPVAMDQAMEDRTHRVQDVVNEYDNIHVHSKDIRRSKTPIDNYGFMNSDSSQLDAVLRGHQNVSVADQRFRHKIGKMAKQAVKVLNHLSKNAVHNKADRSQYEAAAVANGKIAQASDNGVSIEQLAAPFDTSRSGRISYDDFRSVMLQISSGLNKSEIVGLIQHLDQQKLGTINVDTISKSISELCQGIDNSQYSARPGPSGSSSKPVMTTSQAVEVPETTYFESLRSTDLIAGTTMGRRETPRITEDLGRLSNDEMPMITPTYDFINSEPINVAANEQRRTTMLASVEELHISPSTLPDGQRFGKRYSYSDRVAQRPPPYHVEGSLPRHDQLQIRGRKRPQSAPPRSVSMGRSVSELLKPPASTARIRPEESCRESIQGLRSGKLPLKPGRVSLWNPEILDSFVVHESKDKLHSVIHQLRRHDASASGSLSPAEFRQALMKCGMNMTMDQVGTLFDHYERNGRNVVETQHLQLNDTDRRSMKYTQDWQRGPRRGCDERGAAKNIIPSKLLNINHFIDTLEDKVSSVDDPQVHTWKKNEEYHRVCKKVVDTLERVEDPMKFLKNRPSQDVIFQRIQFNDLRRALNTMNANLSDREYDKLREALGFAHGHHDGGRAIPLSDFEAAVRAHQVGVQLSIPPTKDSRMGTTSSHDVEGTQTWRDSTMQASQKGRSMTPMKKHFTRDLRRADEMREILHPPATAAAAAVMDSFVKKSKSSNQEHRAWTGVKIYLRSKRQQILNAFTLGRKSLQEIGAGQLRKSLFEVGVILSDSDMTELEMRLGNKEDASAIRLQDLCRVIDLEIAPHHSNYLELKHASEVPRDGGIFASAKHVRCKSPTFSSTIFNDGAPEEAIRMRKKVLRAELPHQLEPSKFWEMQHSNSNAWFQPHPVHSIRDSRPSTSHNTTQLTHSNLNRMMAARGVVSMMSAGHLGEGVQSSQLRSRRFLKEAPSQANRDSMSQVLSFTSSERTSSASATATAVSRHQSIPRPPLPPTSTIKSELESWGSSALREYFQVPPGRGAVTRGDLRVTPTAGRESLDVAAAPSVKSRPISSLRKRVALSPSQGPPFATEPR